MEEEIVDAIISKARSGAEILFGRGNYGELKIKVRYGPMHLLTKRYIVDFETYQEVRDRLRRMHGKG